MPFYYVVLRYWFLLSCVVIAVGRWRCTGWAMVIGMLLGWMMGVAVKWSGAAAPWVAPSAAITTLVSALGLLQLGSPATPGALHEPGSPVVVSETG